MNKQVAMQNLREINEVLHNIPYWVSHGTLLGFARDRGIIDHDLDTDISVMISEKDNIDKLIPELESRGFVLSHIFGTKEKGLEYALTRNGVKTDIFFHYKHKENINDWIWHAVWKGENMDEMLVYKFPPVKDFAHFGVEGVIFPVPKNYEDFLIAEYGKDYDVPVKDWDYKTSPHNVYEQTILD